MTFIKSINKSIILSKTSKYGAVVAVSSFAALLATAQTPGTAIDVAVINNLSATTKSLLTGNGALIIDGIILAGSAYGTAITRSPGPIVFGVISCILFHIAVKALI